MFETTLRAKVGARASAVEMNFRPLTPRDLSRFAVISSLGFAAVLFLGWLIFANSRQPAIPRPGQDLNCMSLGRGGVTCTRRGADDSQQNGAAGPREDCVFLGKGGRICTQHATSEDHSN